MTVRASESGEVADLEGDGRTRLSVEQRTLEKIVGLVHLSLPSSSGSL